MHTRGKPLAKVIDLDALAGQTPGFTGADLANLVNEAALLAARTGKREIGQVELEEGIMRVIAGPEKKTRVMSEKERLITAYHEMGHAIVGHFLEHADPVHKISVISRGQALGYTISMPHRGPLPDDRAELEDTMAMTLGGRAAEELVFDEITTGASNDIEKVTATAKQMVMRFGMSEKLGPRVLRPRPRPAVPRPRVLDRARLLRRDRPRDRRRGAADHRGRPRARARDPDRAPATTSTTISQILVKRETIEKEQFVALLAGKSEEEVFGVEEERPRRSCRRRPPPPTAPSAKRRARCRGPASPAAPPRCGRPTRAPSRPTTV